MPQLISSQAGQDVLIRPASGQKTIIEGFPEIGIWTPEVVGLTTKGTPIGDFRGNYIKVGKQVTASFFVRFDSLGGMDGRIHILGLPYGSLGGTQGLITCQQRMSATCPDNIASYTDAGTSYMLLVDFSAPVTDILNSDIFDSSSSFSGFLIYDIA